MDLIDRLQNNQRKDRRLQFVRTHQEAFDVKPTFPLPLFEEAILEIEGSCSVESSCQVEGDRLQGGRYEVCNNQGTTWPESLTHAFKLLDKIDSQLGVRINRDSFDQFAAAHVNSRKIINNTIGVHLGSKLEDSSVMLYIHIKPEEDTEELARTALVLDGGRYSDELTRVLLRDTMVIGFELFFDGRSRVDLGPCAPGKSGTLKMKGKHLEQYTQKNLSRKVNSIFREGYLFGAFFSKTRVEPILFFYHSIIKDLPKYFTFNSLGYRVYNFCQSQGCITDVAIAVTETELEKSRLENFCFYYDQWDECKPSSDYDVDGHLH